MSLLNKSTPEDAEGTEGVDSKSEQESAEDELVEKMVATLGETFDPKTYLRTLAKAILDRDEHQRRAVEVMLRNEHLENIARILGLEALARTEITARMQENVVNNTFEVEIVFRPTGAVFVLDKDEARRLTRPGASTHMLEVAVRQAMKSVVDVLNNRVTITERPRTKYEVAPWSRSRLVDETSVDTETAVWVREQFMRRQQALVDNEFLERLSEPPYKFMPPLDSKKGDRK